MAPGIHLWYYFKFLDSNLHFTNQTRKTQQILIWSKLANNQRQNLASYLVYFHDSFWGFFFRLWIISLRYSLVDSSYQHWQHFARQVLPTWTTTKISPSKWEMEASSRPFGLQIRGGKNVTTDIWLYKSSIT